MVLTAGLMRGPVTSFKADPTQLPEATSPGQQRHASFTYGRTLAAGDKYTDPITGVEVLKVTSATVPISNTRMSHGYATSGPRISQAWVGGDGFTYYTIALDFEAYLVDIRYDTLVASNFRAYPGTGDASTAFSMDPATPRILYYVNGTSITRYNTETNADANTGNFPWAVSGSGGVLWLQTQINDTWLACMRGTDYKAWRKADAVERSMSQARSGLAHDELHLDLSLAYVYMSVDEDASANAPWNLTADTFDTSPSGVATQSDDHCAPSKGFVVGTAHFGVGGGAYIYRPDVDQTTHIITDSTGYHDAASDFYTNGNWILGIPGAGAIADSWHLTSKENQDDADAKVRKYAVAWAKNDGSSVRIALHHDSSATVYDRFSKAMSSVDGKFVVFTSDMNGSSRWDVFVAKMPVAA